MIIKVNNLYLNLNKVNFVEILENAPVHRFVGKTFKAAWSYDPILVHSEGFENRTALVAIVHFVDGTTHTVIDAETLCSYLEGWIKNG